MHSSAAALEPLIAEMQRAFPGVRSRIGPPITGEIAPCRDNRDAIQALFQALSERYPDAGSFFWSIRCWGLLEWQATVLAVLGVHRHGLAAPVDAVAISAGHGTSFSHSLPSDRTVNEGEVAELIALAGGRLRRRADALLDDIGAVIPVKRAVALRLLADRTLSVLANLSCEQPCLSGEQAIVCSRIWLSALGLDGASALLPLELAGGHVQPVLDRRSCCLDYREAAGACCASCPRLSRSERMARMRGQWERHVCAR